MKILNLLKFFIILITIPAASANAQTWTVGMEQEVDEGVYMKLIANQNGWRIWRTETQNGVSCMAVKSAKGRPHPKPLGFGNAMFGGTPYITVYPNVLDGKLRHNWHGEHLGGLEVSVRQQGARFWQDWDKLPNYSTFDGQILEVNVESWEYPTIWVGMVEEKGLMDFTGLKEAENAVLDCK